MYSEEEEEEEASQSRILKLYSFPGSRQWRFGDPCLHCFSHRL